ncbi:RNA 2',3'-cyclic phosphodiesterase [Nocardioides panacisoli]|uniref:RNA 2',3'-cyclic phosphodiesterase n=1 Tax=Nocardioides panacisoli TaxID=627624 RepID=UPI001C62F0C3|nr:RNA 2',3'-cyclic phosphodiesterase [Nocardioides panacisoli]QYJ03012.1 RNA 2',3'-cyclic phosphodiesterase [Nocardioides panacisoli]
MRLFAALVPPPEAVADLEEFLTPRRAAADFRWAPAEQFHVTLAFVADAAESRADEWLERLPEALEPVPVVRVRLAGPVAFPDPARARVLATGVDAEDEAAGAEPVLPRLARRTRTAAVRSGLEVDGQRFRPHLTIARMRRPTEVSDWVRLLDTYEGPWWPADRVAVVASHLGEGPRGRPRHETVAEVPVGT